MFVTVMAKIPILILPLQLCPAAVLDVARRPLICLLILMEMREANVISRCRGPVPTPSDENVFLHNPLDFTR